ncbi:MAG: IS1634 family transposase, partial [Candidatus Thermoplasmatota archaeon]|nr:IS1634 family transposase [Candidatus Thermoplasmatota archaeon]
MSDKSKANASAKKIGPSLIFERLWNELGVKSVIKNLLVGRKFEFDVERAIFLTVLHRLFVSGSDRSCDTWHRDYVIDGIVGLELHHLYRAMAFLGEEIPDQSDKTPFSPSRLSFCRTESTRCIKDIIEEDLFREGRDLFSGLEIVFFDTTSIYFEGSGGETLGKKGNSKDHRPDLNQMIVGAVIDDNGRPVCCEMWPGNTTDVKTLLPVTERIRKRFNVGQFCIVADRGMISNETMAELDRKHIPYILGARMRRVNEIRRKVLSRAGRYREVTPEGRLSKDASPLRVKEVIVDGNRYIVCLNTRQARKDARDRQAITHSLQEKIKRDPKALIGNKGY